MLKLRELSMSAKELKNALMTFVKKYKNELLDAGCSEFNFEEGEPEEKFQLVGLDSVKIGRKKYPVELWADTCCPDGEIRYCFSVDFVDNMKSDDFLRYAINRSIPIYLFDTKLRNYKINDFNTLVAEYTTENEKYDGRICQKVALNLDDEEIKRLSVGEKNWGYISYYFDAKKDGAICAIKNFFETILPSLDEEILDDTTRKAVVDSRIGHGKYKEDMLKKWDNACAVSGCSTKEVLIASHAKPWKKCETAKERISSDNGLILCANYDALFDKGLITFENSGKIKISRKVKKVDWECLGLSKDLTLRKKLNDNQKRFMSYHRKNVWQDREK